MSKIKNTIAAEAAASAEATAKVRTAASDAYAAALAELSGAELARDAARNDVAAAKASSAELTAT